MRGKLAVLMGVVVIAIAGCGDDDDGDTAAQEAAGQPVATLDVVETDFEIDPKNATVDEEGLIEINLANEGETVHYLTIETPGEEIPQTSEELDPGNDTVFDVELDSGEYVWYCPVGNHRQMGMEGTLTVGGG
ncbi:MAG TPA: cupredoxin domain-containing protein [Solirubrobacterales bacterium]|nr:cupredoxin domain-containing protein [Solirubrobacterales bacterium]